MSVNRQSNINSFHTNLANGSLTLFGNDVLAQRLYRCLVLANNDFYNNTGVKCFSDEVLKFWSDATSNTLNTNNHEKP